MQSCMIGSRNASVLGLRFDEIALIVVLNLLLSHPEHPVDLLVQLQDQCFVWLFETHHQLVVVFAAIWTEELNWMLWMRKQQI